MDRSVYAELRAHARRLSRNADEAEDLVQDTLLAAVEQGRLPSRGDGAWLAGVMRRQAALRIRGETRRRGRERQADLQPGACTWTAGATRSPPAAFLRRLPPASRQVAVLALHGLDPAEIRWILGLDAAAFRQRLARLRRVLATLDPGDDAEAREAARSGPARTGELAFGRIRRVLKAALRGPALGTHDPDGHLLVVRGHV
jgi:RNA polymerase sigma-70 factor (ECF subfamily)